MGDRRPRADGADAAGGTVGQRVLLFPDGPAAHRHHLFERSLRSGHGERDLLLRTAAGLGVAHQTPPSAFFWLARSGTRASRADRGVRPTSCANGSNNTVRAALG